MRFLIVDSLNQCVLTILKIRYRARQIAIVSASLARVRSLLFSRDLFLLSGRKLSGARVNLARTANDKQRRRAVYAFRAEYWRCLAAQLRGAPRIPEACWIASQTHSLPAPLCYCCQGGGVAAGRQALYRRRGRGTGELPSSLDDFFPGERAFFPASTRAACDEISAPYKGTSIAWELELEVMFERNTRRMLTHGSWKALRRCLEYKITWN